MANIFLAIPQYKKIPAAEIERIRSELKMEGWRPKFDGLHPAVDVSVQALFGMGHTVRYCFIYGDGNLPRVRSKHLGVWRKEYDTKDRCEYFMIMDEDISFPPNAIDILIQDDKPIICGIYTFKTDNPSYIGKPSARFFDENQEVSETEPFKIRWTNGGFVLVKAEVLLDMINHYPELEIGMPSELDMGAEKTWALWCPRVYERELLSEDWAFSQRAREIGYEIWGELRTRLIHWNGEYGFSISLEGKDEDNDIEGWMTQQELNWLFWKSKEMDSVVELGSWKGRSTKALLSGCKGTVYAIDHFWGDETSVIQRSEVKDQDIYGIFMKNVGHFPNLKVLRMDSVDASEKIDSADMVFIDTKHTYDQASKEIDVWLPKTKKLICGHDYDRAEIRRAVQERFDEVRNFKTIWFKQLS